MTPASKDEQRCGGMALPAERQGEPRPAKSLPADSPAAHRVSAGRRQCEDAVGMWHDAFTEECIQQAAFETIGCGTNTAPAAAMSHSCSMLALVPRSAYRHRPNSQNQSRTSKRAVSVVYWSTVC